MKNTLTNEQLIAKAKQWVKELCESGGRKWSLRVPVDLNHDPDVIFIELCNRLEEYALQQPGPGFTPDQVHELNLKFEDYYFSIVKSTGKPPIAMQIFTWFENNALSSPVSTPSVEGMAEALRLKWINLTEDMGRLLSGQRGVSIDKLNKAMNLVQDFVNTMPASLSPGVEDGSGWVKVEDRLPENAGWVNDTVMFWSKKHGHALIGCYDFEFDDWTQQPWTEGAEKLKSSDVTHWRPLPTPPGE
jgi:hypothetical protein